MWTMPVPSSVVTKSPARILKPSRAGPVACQREERPAVLTPDELCPGNRSTISAPSPRHLLDQGLGEDQDLVLQLAHGRR
jgi:hypothetical protein